MKMEQTTTPGGGSGQPFVDEHGRALQEELDRLAALPQVQLTARPVFDRAQPVGSVAQKRGAICKLVCCGGQMDQKCNDLFGENACATVVDAVRLLRLKVEKKHGSESCLAKAAEWQAARNAASPQPAPANNALQALMAGSLELQQANRNLHAAEKSASRARAEHVQATAKLEQVGP